MKAWVISITNLDAHYLTSKNRHPTFSDTVVIGLLSTRNGHSYIKRLLRNLYTMAKESFIDTDERIYGSGDEICIGSKLLLRAHRAQNVVETYDDVGKKYIEWKFTRLEVELENHQIKNVIETVFTKRAEYRSISKLNFF